jgi:hypothetical protein
VSAYDTERRRAANLRVVSEPTSLPKGAVNIAIDRLFPEADPFKGDPVKWAHDKLGRCLWSKQVEILESVRDNRMTAVQSCHGPGKTFTASIAAPWWLDVHDLGSAFAVTTAPSWNQVQTILWREIRRRHREGKLRGRITLDCVWHMGTAESKRADASEEIIAMGRKPADYDEDTFQGIHARYFLALLDERVVFRRLSGTPSCRWLLTTTRVYWRSATQTTRTAISPKSVSRGQDGALSRSRPGRRRCSRARLDCAVCGQLLPEDMLDALVSPQWVEDRRRDWGEGSPIWVSKVEGEFPDTSDEYLISPALVEYAHAVDLPGLAMGRYGLDVARYGEDQSVVYRNRGGQIRLIESWGKSDTMTTAGKAALILKKHGVNMKTVPMNVDIIGIGAGVFDRLREQRFNVAPFQGSQRAIDPTKFVNRRPRPGGGFAK